MTYAVLRACNPGFFLQYKSCHLGGRGRFWPVECLCVNSDRHILDDGRIEPDISSIIKVIKIFQL